MVGKWLIDGNVKNWWIVIITAFFWLVVDNPTYQEFNQEQLDLNKTKRSCHK